MFKFDRSIDTNMSRETLRTRLGYSGGCNQVARMNIDKLKSLKSAIQSSYQSATIQTPSGNIFKCLINPDKLSQDLDDKILSIPYQTTCLNLDGNLNNVSVEGAWETMYELSELSGRQSLDVNTAKEIYDERGYRAREINTNLKEGDVIEWKENNTYWLIFLQYLEETAYFRASLRRCRYKVTLDNGSSYWVYVKGPVEKAISWAKESNNYYNKLNYSLIMYISQNEETLKYIRRFTKLNINGQPWEIQAVDSISTPGLLEVSLKEAYNNTVENDIEAAIEASQKTAEVDPQRGIYIHGPLEVYPYEVHEYELKNCVDIAGVWKIKTPNNKNICKLVNPQRKTVTVSILTGKSGEFELVYENSRGVLVASTQIKIKSL